MNIGIDFNENLYVRPCPFCGYTEYGVSIKHNTANDCIKHLALIIRTLECDNTVLHDYVHEMNNRLVFIENKFEDKYVPEDYEE